MLKYAAAFLVVLSVPSVAQTKKPATKPRVSVPVKKPAGKTTLSGIYTADEARAGREMYAGLCASCHTAASHTGPTFRKKWSGRPLSEIYTFMRTMMPKNDPGSLGDEDYEVLLAYLLQMNRMPAGKTYLSTDTLELRKIRIAFPTSPSRP
jgi:mono/diheme cytochrome c family protein